MRTAGARTTAVLARDTAVARSGPPEPPGVEPVVHATHVEAPALDAESRYPDLFGGEPEDTGDPDPEPVEPAPEEPAATTPAAQEQDDPAVVEAQPMPTRSRSR